VALDERKYEQFSEIENLKDDIKNENKLRALYADFAVLT
jgi:hypothetical protein